MDKQWYYLRNGQSTGPFGVDKFREFAAAGTVDSRTMVWQENMQDWLELGDSEIAHVLDVPPDSEKTALEIASMNKLLLPLFILNCVAWIMTTAAAGFTAVFLVLSHINGSWSIPWAITALCVVAAALIVWIGGFVCGIIQIYRVWDCIEPEDYVASPAKTIVGCLIPFFNIYWYFPAVMELAKLLNARLVREEARTELVNEGLCRRFAIFHALWWLIVPVLPAMICWCLVPGELSRGCIAVKQNRITRRLADTRMAASMKESEKND